MSAHVSSTATVLFWVRTVLRCSPDCCNRQLDRTIQAMRGEFVQPLLQWKSNGYYVFWVCFCGLRYPAGNAHAPCCHLWPGWLRHISPHDLINGTIFEKKKSYWTQNVCFDFLYNFCPKHFSCLFVFTQSTLYSRPILMKLEFSRQIFEKYSNTKFHENSSSGSADGRMGGLETSSQQSHSAIFRTRLKINTRFTTGMPEHDKLWPTDRQTDRYQQHSKTTVPVHY
jgi:hypothetical protein